MTAAANDQGVAHLSDYFSQSLKDRDPELYASMQDELHRQQHEIELIASENIVSKAILEAQGSVLTNKYAEGYPGKRYYGGCEHVDVAENLAIERACQQLIICGGSAYPRQIDFKRFREIADMA